MDPDLHDRLDKAMDAYESILEERGKDYGHPLDNFTRIAQIWSVIFDRIVTPRQVALCMVVRRERIARPPRR
jgi:hypothetical protein